MCATLRRRVLCRAEHGILLRLLVRRVGVGARRLRAGGVHRDALPQGSRRRPHVPEAHGAPTAQLLVPPALETKQIQSPSTTTTHVTASLCALASLVVGAVNDRLFHLRVELPRSHRGPPPRQQTCVDEPEPRRHDRLPAHAKAHGCQSRWRRGRSQSHSHTTTHSPPAPSNHSSSSALLKYRVSETWSAHPHARAHTTAQSAARQE